MVVMSSRNVCPNCSFRLSLLDKLWLFWGRSKSCCNCGMPYSLGFSLFDRIAFTIIFISFCFVQNYIAAQFLPFFLLGQISVVSWIVTSFWIIAFLFLLMKVRVFSCRDMKFVTFEPRVLNKLIHFVTLLLLVLISYFEIRDFYFFELPSLLLVWGICFFLISFNFSAIIGTDDEKIIYCDTFRNRSVACKDIERLSFVKVFFATFLKLHLCSGKSHLLLVSNKTSNQIDTFVNFDIKEVIAKAGLPAFQRSSYCDRLRFWRLRLFQISIAFFVLANILIAFIFGTYYKNWYDINKVLLTPTKIYGRIFSAGSGLSVHGGVVETIITAEKIKIFGIEFPKGTKLDFENENVSAVTFVPDDFSACGEKWSSRSSVYFQNVDTVVFLEPEGRGVLGHRFPRGSLFVYQGCRLNHIQIGDAIDLYGVLLPKDTIVVYQNNEIAFVDIKSKFTFQNTVFPDGGIGVFGEAGIFSLESRVGFNAYNMLWPEGTTFVSFNKDSADLVVPVPHKVGDVAFAKETTFSYSHGNLVASTVKFATTFLGVVWPPNSIFYYSEQGLSEIGTIGKVHFHGNVLNKASYLLGDKRHISKIRFTEDHSLNGKAYKKGAIFSVLEGKFIFDKYAP